MFVHLIRNNLKENSFLLLSGVYKYQIFSFSTLSVEFQWILQTLPLPRTPPLPPFLLPIDTDLLLLILLLLSSFRVRSSTSSSSPPSSSPHRPRPCLLLLPSSTSSSSSSPPSSSSHPRPRPPPYPFCSSPSRPSSSSPCRRDPAALFVDADPTTPPRLPRRRTSSSTSSLSSSTHIQQYVVPDPAALLVDVDPAQTGGNLVNRKSVSLTYHFLVNPVDSGILFPVKFCAQTGPNVLSRRSTNRKKKMMLVRAILSRWRRAPTALRPSETPSLLRWRRAPTALGPGETPNEATRCQIAEWMREQRRKGRVDRRKRKGDSFFVPTPESARYLDTITMPMVLTAVALVLFSKLLMMHHDSTAQERLERKIQKAPAGQGTVRMLSHEEWDEIQEVRPRTPFESKLARPNARLRTGEPKKLEDVKNWSIDVFSDALTRAEESVKQK